MIISKLVKIATKEFEQKMTALGQNWNTHTLTAELAEQVRVGLQTCRVQKFIRVPLARRSFLKRRSLTNSDSG